MMDNVLVCKVNGANYYGNEHERIAASLKKGTKVIFNDKLCTVERVWFYDGIVVDLMGGDSIHPELGDKFELAPNDEITVQWPPTYKSARRRTMLTINRNGQWVRNRIWRLKQAVKRAFSGLSC